MKEDQVIGFVMAKNMAIHLVRIIPDLGRIKEGQQGLRRI